MDWVLLLTSGLACVVYLNTLPAEFAYDDSRAILKNPDLLPETPLWNVFYDDFWGTPLTHAGSHKSYRPICVLTFRFNYKLGGHSPFGYHLTNVVLHALVTGLFVHTVRKVTSGSSNNNSNKLDDGSNDSVALLAGLLFAVHPVHTEAVAGVVGRADILSCLFFLLSFCFYISYCRSRDDPRRVCCSSGRQPSWTSVPLPNGDSGISSAYAGGTVREDNRRDGRMERSRRSTRPGRWLYVSGSVLCAALSMLSKEHGVTVLAVCIIYDVFLHSRLQGPADVVAICKRKYRGLLEGLTVLTTTAAVLIGFRVAFMGSRAPEFSPSDNPASDSDSLLTRILTFAYLPVLNFWLLVCPWQLSFDWSMGSVQLVESVFDPRNLMTLTFYALLILLMLRILRSLINAVTAKQNLLNGSLCKHMSTTLSNGNGHRANGKSLCLEENIVCGKLEPSSNGVTHSEAHSVNDNVLDFGVSSTTDDRSSHLLLLAMALLIFPFIPATNLLFYVGFVIAERVLYIPSMGFCILVAQGAQQLSVHRSCWGFMRWKVAIRTAVLFLIVSFSVRTFVRNRDWLTEEALYRSGISVNPAKAWGNLANILNGQGRSLEAEQAYKAALTYRSNMADVHYNLGILYQEQGRYNEAIQSYKMAVQCRPRLTMAHLNLGIVFATVGMKSEAEQVYRFCSQIDISGLKDPRLHEQTKISALYNLGRLLDDQGRHQEAIKVYLDAVDKLPSHYAPQSLYNMLGEAYVKIGDWTRAEHWYREALRVKPDHIPAHLTLAKLLQKKGLLDMAEQLFLKARLIDPNDASVHQHYGQYLSDTGRHQEAADSYTTAAGLSPTDFELIFNTASSLRQAGRNTEAEVYYRRSVELRPDMAIAYMNLGAMLHFNGKFLEAESSYLTALRLQPDDDVTRANLNKLRNRLRRQ
jgi:tetratricopeptide (TPR) repeat protein